MERAAWEQAVAIAAKYDIVIDRDHIEDSMDTYRDWLKNRSTCPTCNNVTLQQTSGEYLCFNCRATWAVPASQICRNRRILTNQK
jgi:ribosomal protein L37AE/L43A